jgi:hypothetical protein
MAQEPNAILAINSLDRCISGSAAAPLGSAIALIYNQTAPPCNNFQIQSPGALIYGYINKIIVSQIQLQYNVPTVIPERNDQIWLVQGGTPTPDTIKVRVIIPYGFYTPTELAAVLQAQILNTAWASYAPNFTVTYDIARDQFVFATNNFNQRFYFPTLEQLQALFKYLIFKI